MITAYSVFAMIPRVAFMAPAAWAPLSGVRDVENMMRDSGALIGVPGPIYHHVSNLLFSDYCFSTVGCKTPLVIQCLMSYCALAQHHS